MSIDGSSFPNRSSPAKATSILPAPLTDSVSPRDDHTLNTLPVVNRQLSAQSQYLHYTKDIQHHQVAQHLVSHVADYATDEAERILREHQVHPLEPQQEKELDRIMAAAEKEMIKKK